MGRLVARASCLVADKSLLPNLSAGQHTLELEVVALGGVAEVVGKLAAAGDDAFDNSTMSRVAVVGVVVVVVAVVVAAAAALVQQT